MYSFIPFFGPCSLTLINWHRIKYCSTNAAPHMRNEERHPIKSSILIVKSIWRSRAKKNESDKGRMKKEKRKANCIVLQKSMTLHTPEERRVHARTLTRCSCPVFIYGNVYIYLFIIGFFSLINASIEKNNAKQGVDSHVRRPHCYRWCRCRCYSECTLQIAYACDSARVDALSRRDTFVASPGRSGSGASNQWVMWNESIALHISLAKIHTHTQTMTNKSNFTASNDSGWLLNVLSCFLSSLFIRLC